jgi:hypothetical protein
VQRGSKESMSKTLQSKDSKALGGWADSLYLVF